VVAVRGLLLDTSVLIEIERGAFGLEAVEGGEDVGVAAITVTELLLGARLASGATAERRQRFAEHVVETCAVVQYDTATAPHHAALLEHCRRAGTMRGAHDLIIAATARATGRTIVTLDRTGFLDLPNVRVR
jgi:tRNA(fMet)-specific endonuclease VapC